MKKCVKVIVVVLLSVAYATIVSLCIECGLNLLGFSFGVSLDGGSSLAMYPRFVPFCRIVGFSSLAALVGLAIANVKYHEKLDYTDNMWKVQAALAVVLTLPMVKLWELLFEFLQKTL